MKPAVIERGRGLVLGPEVAGGHVVTLDQNFSVLSDADLDAGNRSAHRTPTRLERVIERHDWCGFREPVSLDDQNTEAGPEGLQVRIQGSGPDNEAPEFHAEKPVDTTISPPPFGHMFMRWRCVGNVRDEPHYVVAQHIQNLRYAHEHRDAAALNLSHDGRGAVSAHEHTHPGEHRRDERGQRLPEHVTQRQQVEES